MARRKTNQVQKPGKNAGRQRILVIFANGKSRFVWRDEYTGDK